VRFPGKLFERQYPSSVWFERDFFATSATRSDALAASCDELPDAPTEA
jgi:hypothetical protein